MFCSCMSKQQIQIMWIIVSGPSFSDTLDYIILNSVHALCWGLDVYVACHKLSTTFQKSIWITSVK